MSINETSVDGINTHVKPENGDGRIDGVNGHIDQDDGGAAI